MSAEKQSLTGREFAIEDTRMKLAALGWELSSCSSRGYFHLHGCCKMCVMSNANSQTYGNGCEWCYLDFRGGYISIEDVEVIAQMMNLLKTESAEKVRELLNALDDVCLRKDPIAVLSAEAAAMQAKQMHADTMEKTT